MAVVAFQRNLYRRLWSTDSFYIVLTDLIQDNFTDVTQRDLKSLGICLFFIFY